MATASAKKSNSNYLSSIYAQLIAGREKAYAAFVVAAIASFVARHGFTLSASALNYLQAVVIGVIAHLGVYFTRNTSA